MSELIFNHNLNQIRKLRELKGQKINVIRLHTFHTFAKKPLYLKENGEFTTSIFDAKVFRSLEKAIQFAKNHKDYEVEVLIDSDIEYEVQRIITYNEQHMTHLSYHPDDWTHID